MGQQMLTLRDLRDDARLSTSTLRAWVRAGRLPAIRLGRSIRIEETAWRAFVEQNRMNGTAAIEEAKA
jgi:excisionase family DNA binding protein